MNDMFYKVWGYIHVYIYIIYGAYKLWHWVKIAQKWGCAEATNLSTKYNELNQNTSHYNPYVIIDI